MEWKLALPLHPEYRTLRWSGTCRLCRRFSLRQTRVNGQQRHSARRRKPAYSGTVSGNLLTAGDTKPVLRALKRMLGCVITNVLKPLTVKSIPVRWRGRSDRSPGTGDVSLSGYCHYEDRFVVPSSHRELAREAFRRKMAAALPLVMAATVQIPNQSVQQPPYRCHRRNQQNGAAP